MYLFKTSQHWVVNATIDVIYELTIIESWFIKVLTTMDISKVSAN